jgi:hypothetical protein
MNLEKGDTGVITFGDKSTAKVVVENVRTYPSTGMPADVFFKYQEGETNKKLTHPDFGERFPLPEEIIALVFKKD